MCLQGLKLTATNTLQYIVISEQGLTAVLILMNLADIKSIPTQSKLGLLTEKENNSRESLA